MELTNAKLLSFLDEIDDHEFCIELLLNLQYSSKDDVNYFLDYCCRRIHQSEIESTSHDLIEKLECNRRRLVSFCLIHDSEKFDYCEWNNFRSMSMAKLIINILISGDYRDAFLMWKRHCGGILPYFFHF